MNHPWKLTEGQITDSTGQVVDPLLITAALKDDDGRQIREEIPDIRFVHQSLEVIVEISGSAPANMQLAVGVWKNNSCHTTDPNSSQIIINNVWHQISPESIEIIQELMNRHELIEGSITLGKYINLIADDKSDLHVKDNSIQENSPDSWGILSEIKPPSDLNAEMYSYQLSGSAAMRTLAKNDLGCLLADEMGLGKTLQVISLLLDTIEEGPSLVIMPASLLVNWEREIKLFAPKLKTLIHAGPRRTGVLSGLDGFDVILCSYETAVLDRSFIEEMDWNVLVLDEAQKIKNPESKRSNIIKTFKCRIPVAVTGTPVENYLTDMWSIYEFVLPELLGSKEGFEGEFENTVSDAVNLGRVIANFTIRRKVLEVAKDLPPRIENIIPLELPEEARKEYAKIEATVEKSAATLILRAFCGNFGEGKNLELFMDSPKIQQLKMMAEEIYAQKQKLLIFASNTATLDWLKKEMLLLDGFEGVHAEIIDGRTKNENRQEIVDNFNSSEDPGCLLLNPMAGGVGLNITGANHVIHFNPEWNPAVTEQATARAYRRKQTLPVFVSHFYYRNTVEEEVVHKALSKTEIANALDMGTVMEQESEHETNT